MDWYYLILLSAITNAFFIISTKKVLLKEHSIEFSSALSLLVFLLSLPLLLFIDLNFNINEVALVYIASSFFTIAFLFNMKSIRHMDVSVVAPLMTFNVAITSFLAFIFLGESLSKMQVIGVLLLLAGAYVLQTHHRQSKLLDPLKKMFTSKYIVYLFASLFMFSFAFLMIKSATDRSNPGSIGAMEYLFLLNSFVALNFFIITTLFYNGVKTYKSGLKPLKIIIIPAALILLYRLLQINAMAIPAAKLSLIIALNEIYVFFVVLIGGKMFHEHNIKRKIFGTIIILTGIFFVLYASI